MEQLNIGKPPPNRLGRIVCHCGWDYYIQEDDTKEYVEGVSWNHHDDCSLNTERIDHGSLEGLQEQG